MDIQASKIELIKLILNSESSEFIERVSDIIKKDKNDFWSGLSASES